MMPDFHDEQTTTYEDESEGFMDETNVEKTGKPDIIKVSAKSRSTAVAGAIAAVMREHHHAEVQAIGAGAVNQHTERHGRGHAERTAVRFVVEPRPGT